MNVIRRHPRQVPHRNMPSRAFPFHNDPEYTEHGSLDRVPANVSMLAAAPDVAMPLATIGFKLHGRSQHLAIKNFQPPSYYEDYVMTATYSAKMQSLQQSQLQKLISLHEGPAGPRSFVEIGCGDGSFMKYARQRVSRVVGIEPSRRFAEEAMRAGFEVLVGYVGSATTLTDEKFDCFASRQVFEHLPDPCDVLAGVRRMLNRGAVGLIEVPNGQRALRLKRFFEFFPDHVNYYSVNSLVALASDAGLNVIGCHESFGGDYLELWLRNEPEMESWFEEMGLHRERVCAALTKTVSEMSAAGKRVAIWGCGAKTLSILAACVDEVFPLITAIIDSDPHKHGRFVPNTHIPVIAPHEAAALNPDVVLVLALSYREEIAASARERVPACHAILTLDDFGSIVEL
jgi:SAM-dependent methyltransferase